MRTWRKDGPLGVLLDVIGHIKTPQQHELFNNFQRIANAELPTEARGEILEPVKPVVTRWNSFCSAFERAVKLQPAINAYATHHIRRIHDEDTFAASRRSKLPDAQPWMRSDGLSAADWAVVTEYIEVLRPLKLATKRLEGRGKGVKGADDDVDSPPKCGRYGAIAEIIPVFEYILTYYEQRVKAYEAVDYNAHEEAPEDHLPINLRAAWAKASQYYSKLDHSPAYYAATMLHPYYKNYCETVWANRPDWIASNNVAFQALWGEYKGSAAYTTAVRRPRVVSNDIDDAIDALIDPEATAAAAAADDSDLDEYQRWKKWEPRAEKGSEAANNPIKYWVGLRDRYPNLAHMALDLISIPASSCECERMFSELGDLLEPRRRAISPQLLAAIQCVRRWLKAGFGKGHKPTRHTTDDELDLIYQLGDWDRDSYSE
jgi:hypothetical protein